MAEFTDLVAFSLPMRTWSKENEDGDCVVRCDHCHLPVFCISGMLFCSVSKRTGRENRESWI